jgi:putative tryptophan/tyrosine transport system substrate-binding protein
VQEAAASLKLEAKVVLTRAGDDFDAHLAAMKRAGAAAVLVQPTLPLSRVAAAAAKNRLPAFCPSANFVAEGGLIGYAADLAVLHTQAAALVDKVLKGRKPAELPVEFTTKFHLSVNMKAAKAIGLEISPALLNIADEVIE